MSTSRHVRRPIVTRRGNGEPASTAKPVHTSLSPESAPSTLACAVSNTELSGTARSFASPRNAATSSSGILTSCSPTPGTGLRVHRGTVRIPVILHLPRWVPPPPRAWRDILSLHEEGVGGEGRAITHGYVVEDECSDPQRAASANRGPV